MKNKRVVECGGCGVQMAPGIASKWRDQVPPWANCKRYLCRSCWDMWATWLLVRSESREATEFVQYWIRWNVSSAPVNIYRMGEPCVIDQVSYTQGMVLSVASRAGLLEGFVMRRLAAVLDEAEPAYDWRQVEKMATSVRDNLIYNLSKVINVKSLEVRS